MVVAALLLPWVLVLVKVLFATGTACAVAHVAGIHNAGATQSGNGGRRRKIVVAYVQLWLC